MRTTRRQLCALASCFFFQAEDGIRDSSVTGVQTCALPILKPEASRSARPCAKVAESLNGPTKTRKRLFGPGATIERKPFLPRASLMISASGREVATTCQYCPGGGSPVAEAGAEGVKTCGLGSFAGTGGGGLAAVLAGFSGWLT